MKKGLMKKEKNLAINNNSTVSDIKKKIEERINETDEKIKTGLSKETAGTGTPMSQLSGGAKIMATVSNIGGGSRETGGGGVLEGMRTIVYNEQAKGALAGIEMADKMRNAKTLSNPDNKLVEEKDEK